MNDATHDPLVWSYALCKQIPSMHTIASNYGDLDLSEDDELLEAVRAAVEPILRRRLHAAKDAGAQP